MRFRAPVLGCALVLVAALPALTSCSSGDESAFPGPSAARVSAPAPKPDPVLRLGLVGVTSLDPAMVNPASSSQTILADLLYDGLTSYDAATGTTTGAVANAWAESADGLTWTFHIDPEARFSDGRAITSADVKASLERVASLGLQSVSGVRLAVIDGYGDFVANPASGLRGLDASVPASLVVRLTVPFPSFDQFMSDSTFGIVPAGLPTDGSAFAGLPVGSGPFAVSARAGDVIDTTRTNGSEAALSGVSVRLFPDDAAAHAAFSSGDLDLSVIGIDELAAANAATQLVVSTPQQVSLFYGMNVKSEALSSVAVRQAIVKAVNRDAIRQQVFGDGADTMTGLLGPGVSARRPDACGGACAYDPDGARFVLAQAFPAGGVPNVHVDYFEEPTGREAAIANLIVADLVAVGIPAVPRVHPFDQYSAVVTSGYAELFRFGWIGAFAASDAYLDPLFASGGSDNVFSLADADVDAALAEARSAADDAARTTAVLRAEDRILELNAVVPLVQYRSHLVATDRVHDVVVSHDGTFDVERISLS